MLGLEIGWRNPKASRRERRWHELACDVGRRLYLVEEWVTRGDQHCWAQSVALEVARGARAAA